MRGGISTVQVTKKNSAQGNTPKAFRSIAIPQLDVPPQIVVTFVDEQWINMENKPSLEYYRHVYKKAGYSTKMVDSLVTGLSKSSQYEG